tara:strand:+ start:1720 stop:2028 length:309 start_codon:yes stop_codon:yes gene_type:complete
MLEKPKALCMAFFGRSSPNSRFVLMKYILVLYMCSMINNQCPSSTISGWQFSTHYDCVNAGYGVAQQTFQNLHELEEWDKEYINQNKMVIKFECKAVKVTNT